MAENEHLINGLIRKRAELAGKIEMHQDELRQAVLDLDNVDHTIRLFAPDIDLAEIRPVPLPPRNAAFKGEITRIIFDALRRADAPMDSRQLTDLVLDARGLGTANLRLRNTMQKRVSAALRHHKKLGRLEAEHGREGLLIWRVREK